MPPNIVNRTPLSEVGSITVRGTLVSTDEEIDQGYTSVVKLFATFSSSTTGWFPGIPWSPEDCPVDFEKIVNNEHITDGVGAKTDSASSVLATTAVLNGTLKGCYKCRVGVRGAISEAWYYTDYLFFNLLDEATDFVCSFEWGLTDSYGNTATATGTYTATQSFSKSIANLAPSTLYHFRAKVTNELITGYGADLTFTTSPSTPEVATNPATSLIQTSATLNGTLDDSGGATCDCGFEWGLTTGYGETTETVEKETGETFAIEITGLNPVLRYYFRAVATNTGGTAYGEGREFKALQTGSGGDISVVEERLHWKDNDDNEVYRLGELIGDCDTAPGNLAVVEDRLHYSDAYQKERCLLGTVIGDAVNDRGNIACVDGDIHYVDTSQKERYIKGIPV